MLHSAESRNMSSQLADAILDNLVLFAISFHVADALRFQQIKGLFDDMCVIAP